MGLEIKNLVISDTYWAKLTADFHELCKMCTRYPTCPVAAMEKVEFRTSETKVVKFEVKSYPDLSPIHPAVLFTNSGQVAQLFFVFADTVSCIQPDH